MAILTENTVWGVGRGSENVKNSKCFCAGHFQQIGFLRNVLGETRDHALKCRLLFKDRERRETARPPPQFRLQR